MVDEGLLALRRLDLLTVLPPAVRLRRCEVSRLSLPVASLLELLELLVQVLRHQLERLAIALAGLRIANPSNDLSSEV